MCLLFIAVILCGIQDFTDINNLNRTLRSFLKPNDSIISVDDDLYKFFNINIENIILSTINNENRLQIKFYDNEEHILPKCLGRLININSLLLQHNNLTDLPQYFTKFTSLWLLNLTSNHFNKLPNILFSLKSLIILNLNNNFIERIENNIENLSKLKVLDFSRNGIKYLSKNLKNLKNLQYLSLSYNSNIIRNNDIDKDINKDAKFWKKLPLSIKSLHLNGIQLRYIPYTYNLSELYTLKLRSNLLDNLPLSFVGCFYMSSLDVAFNNLTSIPHFIYHLKKLKRLKLNGNKIENSFYLKKNMLPMLEELDLSYNKITEFEVEDHDFLYYNPLTCPYRQPARSTSHFRGFVDELCIPKTTQSIVTSLKWLSITTINIFIVENLLIFPNLLYLQIGIKSSIFASPELSRSVFHGLRKMQALKKLELIGFNFIIVPKEIFNLISLKHLSLKSCEIKKIPSGLVALPDLKIVNLRYNNIENINPKIFKFPRPIEFALFKNPIKYLPLQINNNNLNFKLEVDGDSLAVFKKDDDNLGIMDISYKKVLQIIGYDLFNDVSISINDLYNKTLKGEYTWELIRMLKIKNKEVKHFQNNYNAIIDTWCILENYITDNNIRKKFRSYLQVLYDGKIERKEETSNMIENIKNNIKSYVEAVFNILININDITNIEPIIIGIEPGLSVCFDGQLQHFSYAYHLLIGEYDEFNSIEYFIKNKIALLKYDTLREITTSNNEEQNVHTFLYWQNELSEILGLDFVYQQYDMDTRSIFLKCKEYILYQVFKLMSVENVVKNICESINKTNSTIAMASQYIYNKNNDNMKEEYVKYEGDIEYLKITNITEKGIYFILEEMGLIKKV